ncbi:RHS repeat domain-containing protein [Bryobacter aggregatus]|uniref:RHS repeat domain-containing protein n=1 Tax=Bryobacter aggregatus TaxID=360054 RepID=UPI001EE272B1|nr:RHS repeat-associated core domain-containing protein [Bryobacter aggregatus]
MTQGTLSPVKYWYDGRDHLVEVEQQDSTSYSGTKTQNRLFAYDSLGRLGSVTNPESGAESYTYWVDGQMKTKTNASSQVVNYAYDAARRLATKSFSGALNTTYCYDGKLWNGSACTMPAGRTDAAKGMKTGSGGAWGSTNYAAVDALGRVSSLKQTVAGLAEQSLSYEYSASGAVKSIGYPSGRQVNVAYTGAGRPSQLSSAARTYLSGMSYGANGALLAETWNGSGADRVEEKRSYNPLGQMLTADFRKNAQDSGRFWKMTNQFPETKNVGNLTKQYVETGIDTFGVRYAYDGLYRLIGAAEDSSNEDPLGTASCATVGGRWCVQYAYDQFGNGWTPSKSGLALGLAQASSNWYLQSSGVVNNRLKDVAYDASGRQRQWKVGDTSSVAVYDPEGHMTEAKGDSAVTPGTEKIYGSYLYNGDGQRVKSVADGKTVWYVYGLDGGVAAEFATGYTNVNAGKTLYPVTDHLGSTRAWFDQTGTVTQRVDYEPFGGEIQRTGVAGYSGLGDPAQKFSGKERDAETGLDYFESRYFSSAQGRFTSPDVMMGKPEWLVDPQRWNRYAYVRNNPLKYIDPNGEDLVVYYSLGSDVSDADREWFNKNKASILAGIQAKFEKAGVKNVSFRDQATLSKKQLGELDNGSPLGVSRLTFVGKDYPGLGQAPAMGVLGYAHPDGKRIAGVFLDTFPKVSPSGCDQACIAGDVAAHELGHTIGIPHLGFMEEMADRWRQRPGLLGGTETRPDLMTGSMGVPTQPLYFKPGTNERTQRAIEQLNRIGDMTPKK